MNTTSRYLLLILLAALTGLLTAATRNSRQPKNDNLEHNETTIKSVKASFVYADISFPAGILKIASTSEHFFEGDFTYDKTIWKPKIAYEESDEVGELKVGPDMHHINLNNDSEYIWDMKLNGEVEMDVNIRFGAGRGELDFQDMNITELDITLGAGEYQIDLRRTALAAFDFNAGAGSAVIDLTGDWNQSLNADLNCGIGEISLKLPSRVGVKVEVRGLLGEINTNNLIKVNRNEYRNELFGETEHYLNIDINGGIGEVNLMVED